MYCVEVSTSVHLSTDQHSIIKRNQFLNFSDIYPNCDCTLFASNFLNQHTVNIHWRFNTVNRESQSGTIRLRRLDILYWFIYLNGRIKFFPSLKLLSYHELLRQRLLLYCWTQTSHFTCKVIVTHRVWTFDKNSSTHIVGP